MYSLYSVHRQIFYYIEILFFSTKDEEHTLDVGDPDNRFVNQKTKWKVNFSVKIFLAPAAPEGSEAVHTIQCGQH